MHESPALKGLPQNNIKLPISSQGIPKECKISAASTSAVASADILKLMKSKHWKKAEVEHSRSQTPSRFPETQSLRNSIEYHKCIFKVKKSFVHLRNRHAGLIMQDYTIPLPIQQTVQLSPTSLFCVGMQSFRISDLRYCSDGTTEGNIFEILCDWRTGTFMAKSIVTSIHITRHNYSISIS